MLSSGRQGAQHVRLVHRISDSLHILVAGNRSDTASGPWPAPRDRPMPAPLRTTHVALMLLNFRNNETRKAQDRAELSTTRLIQQPTCKP